LGFAKRSDVSAGEFGLKANRETSGSGGRCARLEAYFRSAPEIPTLVVDVHGRYFFGRKGNFLEPSDFDDASLAGDNLIEGSAIAEFHGNDLIADAGLS
jgi:hypothetical protein